MPSLPLNQQIYLYGVIAAFLTFMVFLAWGYFQANRRPAPARRAERPVAVETRAADETSRSRAA